MGVVYQAQQLEPIRRVVALKIIKPGMDSKQVIARFESERQTLAMMDHGNIARVFDAGTTASGLPYFVMELVDGVPITRYCDSKRLTVRERIDLFIAVCKAIQHAHQKGILHRDIKPSNILVTEQDGKPVPKVIDFGLAKALGRQLNDETDLMTTFGTVVGTLQYMSPEQAEINRQDVDTRSDIYSLGVVLYELMTGTTPLDREQLTKAAYVELLRAIREEEPVSPSARIRRSGVSVEIAVHRRSNPAALPKLVHGELDWITMKALEKDRARRFETVNGLVRDLERYLSGEPVEAGPPSATYRLMKAARKHRVALATVAGFLALIAGAVVYSAREAIRARRAERVAEAVNSFLLNDLLGQASSSRQGGPDNKPDPDIKVRTALDRAAARVGGKFKDQPEVEAAVRRTIGLTYIDLGLYAQARSQMERASAVFESSVGRAHRDTLSTINSLAIIDYGEGKFAESEARGKRVVADQRRLLGPTDPDTLASLEQLAATYTVEAKFKEGEKILEDVLALRRKQGGDSPESVNTMRYLGQIYSDQGKFKEAEAIDRPALEASRRLVGPMHPTTLSLMSSLAEDLRLLGKYPEAEALSAETLDAKKRTYGPDHESTITAMNNLAGVYLVEGKHAEAEALNRLAVEADKRVKGPEHPETLAAMHNLASTVFVEGKIAEAEAIDKEVFDAFVRVKGREHWQTIVSGDLLGGIYTMEGKYAQAEAIHSESLAIGLRTAGAENPNTLVTMNRLATVYLKTNRFAEAEKLQAGLLAGMRKTVGPEHPNTLIVSGNISFTRHQLHKDAEVVDLMRQAVAIHESKYPDGWQRFRCESLLGAGLTGLKQYAEAEPHLLKGFQGMVDRLETIPADARRNVANAANYIVELYQAWGKPAEAAKWRAKTR